ncbi:MAG TPA: MotA/TolQ/ExbB proton channel family protein [Spirochaetia bacterium]|nr:MotA/TolQ/ExbB proton channel family protein [Spirochaetia bacterium]
MVEVFLMGGPVMWPLLAVSIVSLSIIIERLLFWMNYSEERKRTEQAIERISGNPDRAVREIEAALKALVKKTIRGLSILDTVVTVAPLLGILGTVTGIISAFRVLQVASGEAPRLVSLGIAEALLTTAFGLIIAIFSVIPFNYFSHRAVEESESLSDYGTGRVDALKQSEAGCGESNSRPYDDSKDTR